MGAVAGQARTRPIGMWIANAVGTGILAGSLLYTRTEQTPHPGLLGTGLVCWLVFVALERRRPVSAVTALAACSVLAAATPEAGDGTGMLFVSVMAFSASLVPVVAVIVGLVAADIALVVTIGLLSGASTANIAFNAAGLLVVSLIAWNRRQHAVQARQTEELLEQTRRAQHEHARAAALDERARIAREMHDVLAHSLGALGIQLEVAEALLDRDDTESREKARTRVRRARRLAVDGLAEARRAVTALRDDVPSVPDALDELADGFRGDHGTPVTCAVTGTSRPVPPEAAVSLVRIAREALTNAARHAPGAAVTVTLVYEAESVRLTVRNAAGAPVTAVNGTTPGFGLAGMRERIALAGGTLAAGRTETGWLVEAEVPA